MLTLNSMEEGTLLDNLLFRTTGEKNKAGGSDKLPVDHLLNHLLITFVVSSSHPGNF